MAEAKKRSKVKVDYTGKLNDGTVFDKSHESKPIEFTIGEGKVIKAFEDAVIGMKTGEEKTIKVPPEKAYGPHKAEGMVEMPCKQLPKNVKPKIGDTMELESKKGHHAKVRIVEITDEKITLDANHPLAGKELTFDIKLVEIL